MIGTPRRLGAALVASALGACSLVEGYPELAPDPGAQGGAAATSGGGGSTGATVSCTPLSTAPCYSGPAGTEGVGQCASGTATCTPEGNGYGPCVGETLPSAEDCATAADEDCDGEPSCDGALRWGKRFGDRAQQDGAALAADGAGDVWVTGSFDGALDFGPGPLASGGSTSAFLAKLSASGEPKLQAAFADAIGRGVAVDGGGAALVALACRGDRDFCGGVLSNASGNNHDVCLAKIGADAGCLWTRRFGDRREQSPAGVAVDRDGGIAIAGSFRGQMDFGGDLLQTAGGVDLFVAALGPDGSVAWAKRFGDGSDQIAAGVAIDASGVVVVGYTSGAIDFGGGALQPLGGDDVVIAKLDRQGHHLWSQRYGSSGEDRGLAVAVGADGDVIVTGSFTGVARFQDTTLTAQGARDIFLRKMTADGAERFTKGFGDGADQVALGVAAAGGGVVVTGRFQGALSFGGSPITASTGADDIFVAKLDAAGGHLWSRRFGDPAAQLGAAVASDPSGAALVTGTIAGSADFGGGLLTSAGAGDLFVAKFAP